MTVHRLSRADARRIAVRAQLLDGNRPTDLLDVVRHLTLVQNDPTSVVAPSAELVLWSRLGSSYDSDGLWEALDAQRLIELHMMLRPREDLRLYTAEMAMWPGPGSLREWQEGIERWVAANEACRLDILERLRMDGPLPARELPDSCVLAWRSSGWTNNQNVAKMLDFMVQRGDVACAGRDGRERLWDLAERVYPDDPPVPYEEALRVRAERRLRALGIARPTAPGTPTEPSKAGPVGEPAVVDGVRGRWRVDPEQLARLGEPFTGRTAILSPLDRLVFDRKRMAELFEFHYQLEMYKPVAKRRWGYWAMPVLHGDRLVGKVDATADRG
ncbi:MAG TPA: crosslink repair DNA glycosylase YcaQ family protein, partial [Actinomycetes bacterium]|nr:crosslink repair DNA glycosylase YcaQ family protein [Actinomycetes bacterium]